MGSMTPVIPGVVAEVQRQFKDLANLPEHCGREFVTGDFDLNHQIGFVIRDPDTDPEGMGVSMSLLKLVRSVRESDAMSVAKAIAAEIVCWLGDTRQ